MNISGERANYLQTATAAGRDAPGPLLRALESLLMGSEPAAMTLCQERDDTTRTWHALAVDDRRLTYVRATLPADDFDLMAMEHVPEAALRAWTRPLRTIRRIDLMSTSQQLGGWRGRYVVHFEQGEPLNIPPIEGYGSFNAEVEGLVKALVSRM